MNRPRPTVWPIVALLAYPAWLAMAALHEVGHVLHALLSGGRVERVHFPLADFSRTDLAVNPHPLFVAWGGPAWGCLIPLALLAVAHAAGRRGVSPARLFAGFCLIANGAYIGLGPLMTASDGHDLLRHGAPAATLILFGILAATGGLYLWHLASRPLARPTP